MAMADVLREWWLYLVLGLAALAVLLLQRLKQRSRQKGRLPPGPPGLPVFGNLLILVTSSHPHQELHRLAQKYGPIMSLRLGSKNGIVVSSPEIAKEVLKTLDREFANRPYMTAKDAIGYGDSTMGFTSYGAHWRFLRKITNSELLNAKRVQQFQNVRAEELSSMVKSILEDTQRSPLVDIQERASFLTMNVMTRILMSKRFFSYTKSTQPNKADDDPEDLAAEFKSLIDETFFLSGVALIGDVIPYLGFLDRIMNYEKRMRRVHQRFDSFLSGVLEEHRQTRNEKEARNYFDILLSLPGEDGGPHLDEDVMKALTMDMITAGTDTSSITVEWGLSELLRNPQILHRVYQELDEVVGKERVITESDLPNLPYFQAVVKETFRLHPAGPLLIPHATSEACEVAGFHIPAETTTFVNAWSIARHPDVWDNPLEFRPDRFLNSDIDVRGQHFQLLPFGSGRRVCPGIHLGIVTVQYALARLVHSFDWALPQGQAPHDLNMEEKFGLTLPRAKPLLAVPLPRLPPHLYE